MQSDDLVPYVAEFGTDEDGTWGPFVTSLDDFNRAISEANYDL